MSNNFTQNLTSAVIVLFVLHLFLATGKAQDRYPEPEIFGEKEKALFKAIEKGNLDLIKKLIADGANVNAENDYEESALIFACRSYMSDEDIYEAIIEGGVDLKKYGLDAINAVVDNERPTMIRLLIKFGFDVNSKDALGRTALFYVDADNMKTLINAGANVNEKDDDEQTPLMEVESFEEAKLLIAAGADVNARDVNGNTPLMFAADRGNIEVLKGLIEAGAAVNAKNKKSETALTKARQSALLNPNDSDWKTVMEFLKSKGGIN